MSTQTQDTITPQQELRETAFLISEHLESAGGNIQDLGGGLTAKTLQQVRRGDFSGLDVASLLVTYREIRATLAAETGAADDLYEDLSTAQALRRQFSRLKLSQTSAKLILVEGYTGAGKTSAGRIIARKYNEVCPTQQVFTIEASAGWGDRPNAMMAAMLKALGRPDGARNQAARLDKLAEVLNERPVVFIVDEVHDFGVRCLRVIKTLLNLSKVKVVMLCHPRLFKDLERENWDDLSQLTGNRLLARISLGNVNEADVELLLTRRLPSPGLNGDTKAAAKTLADSAVNNGNLAFVREVIVRLAKSATSRPGGKLTLEDVAQAARQELRARRASGTSL